MAATSWDPAYDQDAGSVKVVTAHVNMPLTTAMLQNPFLPMMITPMTDWMLDEAMYVEPAYPIVGWPPNTGRGFPRDGD